MYRVKTENNRRTYDSQFQGLRAVHYQPAAATSSWTPARWAVRSGAAAEFSTAGAAGVVAPEAGLYLIYAQVTSDTREASNFRVVSGNDGSAFLSCSDADSGSCFTAGVKFMEAGELVVIESESGNIFK